jgi:hypothetical protein
LKKASGNKVHECERTQGTQPLDSEKLVYTADDDKTGQQEVEKQSEEPKRAEKNTHQKRERERERETGLA